LLRCCCVQKGRGTCAEGWCELSGGRRPEPVRKTYGGQTETAVNKIKTFVIVP
jgi:hypothetical protein